MLSGKVVLRDHSFESPYDFTLIDVATPGTILNHYNYNVTDKIGAFYVVYSTQAVIAKISDHNFNQLWGSYDVLSKIKVICYHQSVFYKHLTEQTQRLIKHEGVVKFVPKGCVVMRKIDAGNEIEPEGTEDKKPAKFKELVQLIQNKSSSSTQTSQ